MFRLAALLTLLLATPVSAQKNPPCTSIKDEQCVLYDYCAWMRRPDGTVFCTYKRKELPQQQPVPAPSRQPDRTLWDNPQASRPPEWQTYLNQLVDNFTEYVRVRPYIAPIALVSIFALFFFFTNLKTRPPAQKHPATHPDPKQPSTHVVSSSSYTIGDAPATPQTPAAPRQSGFSAAEKAFRKHRKD